MPTENRSSNTEMVSVPREPTAEMLAAAKKSGVIDPRVSGYCYALMVAAAPTHQGEPVAYLCKAEGAKWLQYGRKVGDPWKPGEVQVTPLYTHADPGEVERLRAENEQLREVIKHSDSNIQRQSLRISNQRTQLAEMDALLREVLVGLWPSTPLAIKINAALSASAEPSAAVIHPINMKAMMQAYEQVDHKAMLHGTSNWCAAMATALRGTLHSETIAPVERGPWLPLSAPGQIQEGDWLCFTVSGSFICAQARLIIYPGTDKEEIVYNRKKNHYFCTDMAIAGTSNHKGVLVARAAPERKPS